MRTQGVIEKNLRDKVRQYFQFLPFHEISILSINRIWCKKFYRQKNLSTTSKGYGPIMHLEYLG